MHRYFPTELDTGRSVAVAGLRLTVSDIPAGQINRPKLFTRACAGIGVVLAALVPVAALVLVILQFFHVLPFGRLT